MKRLIPILVMLLFASTAHAQYLHNPSGTTTTLTCTNTGGTSYSTDVFYQTLTGSTVYTLPAAAANCLNRDHVELSITQGTNQSYTVTVNAGAGTAIKVLSANGSTLTLPPSTGSSTDTTLRQIWVYDTAPGTPEWHLVTQETLPASTGFTSAMSATTALSGYGGL